MNHGCKPLKAQFAACQPLGKIMQALTLKRKLDAEKQIVVDFPQLNEINLKISKMHPPLPGIMKSVALELDFKR